MHRTWGGIVAGALFVLPSLFILIALSWIYVAYGDVPLVAGIFYGIKPAVTAIVLFAALAHRLARAEEPRAVGDRRGGLRRHLRASTLPFPAIVLAAGIDRLRRRARLRPASFQAGGGHGAAQSGYGPALIDDDTPTPAHALLLLGEARRVLVGVGLALWALVIGALALRRRLGRHARADGLVLHQGGAAHLRRRLRGAALRLPGRGRALRLADRRRR